MKGVQGKDLSLSCHDIKILPSTTDPWNSNADFAQCMLYKNHDMQTC